LLIRFTCFLWKCNWWGSLTVKYSQKFQNCYKLILWHFCNLSTFKQQLLTAEKYKSLSTANTFLVIDVQVNSWCSHTNVTFSNLKCNIIVQTTSWNFQDFQVIRTFYDLEIWGKRFENFLIKRVNLILLSVNRSCHVFTTASQHSLGFLRPAPSTSVGAQRRCEPNSSIFSVRSNHTAATRRSLAAVSRTHRLQCGCAHLPMPSWSGTTSSLPLHPDCHWLQHRCLRPSSSMQLVINIHDCLLSTIVLFRWPLKQSATRCHLSSNTDSLSELPYNLSVSQSFPSHPSYLLLVCCFLHGAFSGLVFLYLGNFT